LAETDMMTSWIFCHSGDILSFGFYTVEFLIIHT